jgi:hypothetical protein
LLIFNLSNLDCDEHLLCGIKSFNFELDDLFVESESSVKKKKPTKRGSLLSTLVGQEYLEGMSFFESKSSTLDESTFFESKTSNYELQSWKIIMTVGFVFLCACAWPFYVSPLLCLLYTPCIFPVFFCFSSFPLSTFFQTPSLPLSISIPLYAMCLTDEGFT